MTPSSIANSVPPVAERSLVSGTLAGLGTSLIASVASKYLGMSPAAPLNAISHVIWGEKAAAHSRASIKYTLTGFVINQLASILWAAVYESIFKGRKKQSDAVAALTRGAVISAAAFAVDYYLVPKRLTPGYEKRLPSGAVALIYGGLALGLVFRDLKRSKRIYS
ncbi:MAG: hypothetical protein H0U63_05640 [Burkholderiales bacterium]|nr:hypothetical protein [Burkholderiales bacterium]